MTAFPLSAWGRVCVSSLAARGPMERRASASLWQTCSDTVLQRRVAMEVAGLGGSADLTSEYLFPFERWHRHYRWNRAPSAYIVPSPISISLSASASSATYGFLDRTIRAILTPSSALVICWKKGLPYSGHTSSALSPSFTRST